MRSDTRRTVSATDLPRFAELNATAELSPYFWSPGSILGERPVTSSARYTAMAP